MTYKEGYNVSIKREYTLNIIKTVIAFANTNDGRMYIGIEDDGNVIGVDDTDALQLQI